MTEPELHAWIEKYLCNFAIDDKDATITSTWWEVVYAIAEATSDFSLEDLDAEVLTALIRTCRTTWPSIVRLNMSVHDEILVEFDQEKLAKLRGAGVVIWAHAHARVAEALMVTVGKIKMEKLKP